ncbi:RHS repeat-associated core domain-containing protein [uncultured Chitinophaga sp.]|uniref:RHS repeat domain-containing protein n=1 Tax=uncultured Chitinophaga sp. TaxID=339340 RepID=UPI002638D8FB|nr:RHS repeat-associated core domain-containing protein [uncultured Chitinophaga sp.]
MGNHLGNVLATVTDRKMGVSEDEYMMEHYEADVASAQDYYPFGMMQPGRRMNVLAYRYGFNGKENDNEVKGKGNQQDYGMRIYDPRVARFLSVDPLARGYPELTPYQFASNKPINSIDLDGLESWELRTPVVNLNTSVQVNYDGV